MLGRACCPTGIVGAFRYQFMTRSSHPIREHILDFDDDFERTLRRNRNQQDRNPPIPEPKLEEHPLEEEEEDPNVAADNQTIKEPSASGLDNAAPLCIQYPMAALRKTDEFELKSSLLHHIPKFNGMSMEDPNKHMKEFEVVCSSMTHVNVDGSIMKIKAFPFSLLEKAKDWLYELAPGTVTSWESMKRAFLEKFFPTFQVILLRKRINGIQQNQDGRRNEDERTKWARKTSQSNAKPRQKGGPNGEANWADYGVCRTIQRARFMQSKKEEAEKDILETFRKVQVNIPLLDAIKLVPRNTCFESAMLDLGASINVMPYSIYASIHLGELKKDGVIIQLADRSNAYPKGVLEDVLVQVNHLIFPADFYVLEMDESDHSLTLPILFGWPFMKTARTKIDVFNGTLTMEFDGEVINFNLSDSIKYPSEDHSCFSIDVFASLAQDHFEQLNDDALELVIARGMDIQNNEAVTIHPHGMNDFSLAVPPNEDVIEMVAALESLPLQSGKFLDPISISILTNKLLPSIVQPPTLELKSLPSHLKYVFLGDYETLPVIISSILTAQEEDKLVRVLREYKTAIGWTLADIKGISPTTCMHCILLEEGSKTSREA
ncbi:unnamed protein product [Malus baccata var. baccata]